MEWRDLPQKAWHKKKGGGGHSSATKVNSERTDTGNLDKNTPGSGEDHSSQLVAPHLSLM